MSNKPIGMHDFQLHIVNASPHVHFHMGIESLHDQSGGHAFPSLYTPIERPLEAPSVGGALGNTVQDLSIS